MVLTIFAKGVPADSVVIDFGEQMVRSAHTIVIVPFSFFTVFTNFFSHFS